MPRTYSYDHFQVPKVHPNSGSEVKSRNRNKKTGPESKVPPSQMGGVHYGHAHAETAERYQRLHEKAEQREAQGDAELGGGRAERSFCPR